MPETALPLAQKAAQLLAERGIENARLEADLLLAHILGIKRLDLYLQFDRPLTEAQLEQFRAVVRRRLKREPLQYITGRVQFRHVELEVDRRVLIPRPETEVLVGVVLDFIRGRSVRVLDVGTGSGAIALSIAKECPGAFVVASDVSRGAAEVAERNAKSLGLGVELRVGDLFDVIGADEKFDVVVSNPPYVGLREKEELQPEVKDWEPHEALFAGDDGMTLYPMLTCSHAHMLPGGLLALEIGATQAQAVKKMLEETDEYKAITVHNDLSGRERIVTAVKRDDV